MISSIPMQYKWLSNRSIWSIDGIPTCITTPAQCVMGVMATKKWSHNPHSSKKWSFTTGIRLVLKPGYFLGVFLFLCKKKKRVVIFILLTELIELGFLRTSKCLPTNDYYWESLLSFRAFCRERKIWKSLGARSGEYSGQGRRDQPKSNTFSGAILAECIFALWWRSTTFLLLSCEGRFLWRFRCLLFQMATDCG